MPAVGMMRLDGVLKVGHMGHFEHKGKDIRDDPMVC